MWKRIEGLTPAIAMNKNYFKNPRSTVGTITEVYDYFRLLYARLVIQHCHPMWTTNFQMSVQVI